MKKIIGILTALTVLSSPAFARSAPIPRTAKSVTVKKATVAPKAQHKKHARRISSKKKDVVPKA